MAPRRSVRSLSGMTRSGSMCCSTPSPPHFGQAPNGLLNENSRGSISGMVKPETGQANFSEKMMRLSAGEVACPPSPPEREDPAGEASAKPSAAGSAAADLREARRLVPSADDAGVGEGA